jgi:hypothetical protein
MKVCNKCHIEKDFSEFHKRKDSKDGYRNDCKECNRQSNKLKYSKNKEKIRERHKQYYKNNTEYLNKINKNNKNKNKEKYKNTNKEYYLKNQKKILEYKKEYNLLRPEKRKAVINKRRASKKQCTPPWIDIQKEEIEAIYKKANDLTKKTGIKHHVDHIYPLTPRKKTDPIGLHVIANLQILTEEENLRKHNMQPQEWEELKTSITSL